MAAPLLFVENAQAAGSCICYRYINSTPVQIGDPFGSKWTTANQRSLPRHSAVQYKGNLYALAADGVYVKDDPTTLAGTWTQDIAFTNPVLTQARTSGLHIVVINGEPILTVVFGDAASINRWRWAKFDGTTWTQAASDTIAGVGQVENYESIVYRNAIHMIGGSSVGDPNALVFDPTTESFTTPTEPWSGLQQACLSACIFNDRLFVVWYQTASGNTVRLSEYVAGSWVDLPGSDGGYNTVFTTMNAAKWSLFTDGTFLYGLVPAETTDGWRCLRWDNTLGTPTDITSSVLPSDLQSSTDGGSYAGNIEDGRFVACIDQNSDPLNPEIDLFFSVDGSTAGNPWSLYSWNGNAALIGSAGVAEDTGGASHHSPPSGMNFGGEHIFTPGELDALIVGKAAVFGGQQIQASFWGDAGAADKNAKLYYATEGEPTLQEATLTGTPSVLSGPAAAPTLNGGLNRLEGVEADDGASVYAFTWDIATDGISVGDRVQLFLRIFV